VHADTTALAAIDEALARMAVSMTKVEQNTLAVEQLAEVALPLQDVALRVGRFAERLPTRRGGAARSVPAAPRERG
jgi:hypothetical protein